MTSILLTKLGRVVDATLLFLFIGSPTWAQALPPLDAVPVVGLTQPLFITAPKGDYGRIFIVRQNGQVEIYDLSGGGLHTTPYLDISDRLTNTFGEQGLLGMAFDPNYAINGKFYLHFTVPGGAFGNGISHVSQFKVSADRNIADTSDEKILLTWDHPTDGHNGGWIGFSPRVGDENNLYITSGDGGNANDMGPGHTEPGGNAQDTTKLLGKMLRIHIDAANGTASIPPDNPFAGSPTARQEIFSFGLRNPYCASFDRLSGTLFVGDVGQSTREEVDVQKPSNPGGGENYGWRVREGSIQNPAYPNDPTPPGAVDPIFDYPRAVGGTVTGGYVYRGRQIPALRGTYIFGDYLSSKIFALDYDGNNASNFQDITADLFPTGGYDLSGPVSFGEDANGEPYVASINNGIVFKIVPTTPNVDRTTITKQLGGHAFISAFGVPFKAHSLQAASTPVEPFMSIGAPVIAAGNGFVQFEDASPAPDGHRFYRVVYP